MSIFATIENNRELEFDHDEYSIDDFPSNDELGGLEPPPALIRSVLDFGIINPVMVALEDGGVSVLSGRRRIKAARKAQKDSDREIKVPVMVLNASPKDIQSLLKLSDNAMRSENPIIDLEAIESLEKAGYPLEEVARASGMPKQTVERRMLLSKLPRELREATRKGHIKVTVAERAAKLPGNVLSQLVSLYQENGKLIGKDITRIQEKLREDEAQRIFSGDAFKVQEGVAQSREFMAEPLSSSVARAFNSITPEGTVISFEQDYDEGIITGNIILPDKTVIECNVRVKEQEWKDDHDESNWENNSDSGVKDVWDI